MLLVIPLAACGPTQIFIFDIHALQERFYFSDQVIPRYTDCACGSWRSEGQESTEERVLFHHPSFPLFHCTSFSLNYNITGIVVLGG